MRKMILSFTLGSLATITVLSIGKTICCYKDDIMGQIKNAYEKLKNQMQSSKTDACCSLEETIDDLLSSLESLDEDTLPSRTKKAIVKVKNTLENIK